MSDEEVVVCDAQRPSEESLFWLEVGRETAKSSVSTANDAAKQMIALSTALISGYLGLVKLAGISISTLQIDTLIGRLVVMIPVFLWLLCLLESAYALLPSESQVSGISPTQIKASRDKSVSRKARRLCWAFGFFLLGLLAVTAIIVFGDHAS